MTCRRAWGGFLFCCATLILLSSPVSAGPPFVTDDPEPTDYQHYEIYLFSLGTQAAGGLEGVAPSCDCNYGALPNLQLHIQPALAVARVSGSVPQWGLADLELGLKYRFIEQDKESWIPSVAFYPKLEAPSGDAARGLGTGRTHAFLPFWLQKDFDAWTVYGGGGFWINPGPGNKNFWFVGGVLERKITDQFTLGGELFYQTTSVTSTPMPAGLGNDPGLQPVSIPIGMAPSIGFNIGGIYDFSEQYHILFSAGKGLLHARETNEFSWYLGFELTGGL